MTDQEFSLLQNKIVTAGWTPGRKDMEPVLKNWSRFTESEREILSKKIAKVDAPSARKAAVIFPALPDKCREELCRPLLKAFYAHFETQQDPEDFPLSCLSDESARVRKAACQATGSSWAMIPGMYRENFVARMIANLETTRDQSEIKALTEALGKSSAKEALEALNRYSEKSSGAVAPEVLLKARRDQDRVDTSQDYCRPELLDCGNMIVWFTSGIDRVAQMREPFLGADQLDDGVLGISGTSWQRLWEHTLWRDAGIVLATDHDWTPRKIAAKLAAQARVIQAATHRGMEHAPARIRLGRGDGRGRSFIWDFAVELDRLTDALINDGRSAHWELRVVGEFLVLVPLVFAVQRFPWRDVEIDGASDPTVAAALVYLAAIKDGESVLDPFCGGCTELVFAGITSPRARLAGTDIHEAVLDDGRRALQRAGIQADLRLMSALDLGALKFDVMVTNPPFGIRTVRGQARELLAEFLGKAAANLTPSGRIVMLSHAPKSSREWAAAGGLRLVRSFPLRLGKMGCEIQVFSPQGPSS